MISSKQSSEMYDRSRRLEVSEALYRRYGVSPGSPAGLILRLRIFGKKNAWTTVVSGSKLLKRIIDIVASVAGMLVLSPVFLIVSALIKLTDFGPVFYFQTRVGQYGAEFRFPKFRSMRVDADKIRAKLLESSDHGSSITFKMKKDPRITWIGRIIRKLSIDELPQLWCVMTGKMSLVGPRPPIPSEVAQYTLADRRRLDVIPGLTCIWQVSGRADIPFDQQVQLDVMYIESHSFWLDVKLLLKTVPAVLLGKGAY